MITVKLYGLMRVESGIRELQMQADTTKTLLLRLQEAGLKKEDLRGCCLLINGSPAKRVRKLNDGDVVQLLPPVAGG